MSQEVDERVVEMRFDNAQFEKNVHQTMQSLEKLNDSLRLEQVCPEDRQRADHHECDG